MLVHTSVSNAAGSRMSEVIAVVYDVLLGKPAEPGSPITLSHGYHVNPEQMYIGGKRYENIYSFMDALDFKAKHRIDAELHLHMMKWRIMPQLKPENITGTRVCVIGAGALGCHIIRQLLAWGISDFVVVDHAKVANSTRQCLYDSQDIANQEYKAVAACAKIKRIRPDAQVLSMNLQVPMPGMCIIISRDLKLVGHFITEEQLKHSYSELENAMLTCDVVFLATDSKESRWLPSLIGAAHRAGVCKEHETPSGECTLDVDNTIQAGPLVISAGLAFDSFMVVRHGYGTFRGGCYFCTDVQPPHDTVSGR
ncbi:autophagy protein [Babesia caballi]|uniref:Autophagy protein n=1 Tax=Babesia caballi TaxID=5871 RepID=A0AAV4LT55_BABCB|nr:autophagy protein [Babesia caballi]